MFPRKTQVELDMKSKPTTAQSSTRSGEGNAMPAPTTDWLAAIFALVLLVRMNMFDIPVTWSVAKPA